MRGQTEYRFAELCALLQRTLPIEVYVLFFRTSLPALRSKGQHLWSNNAQMPPRGRQLLGLIRTLLYDHPGRGRRFRDAPLSVACFAYRLRVRQGDHAQFLLRNFSPGCRVGFRDRNDLNLAFHRRLFLYRVLAPQFRDFRTLRGSGSELGYIYVFVAFL